MLTNIGQNLVLLLLVSFLTFWDPLLGYMLTSGVHSHIFMNLGISMLWEGQGVLEDDLQRKLTVRAQTTQARKRIMVLILSYHHNQLVHLVLNLYILTLPKPGILLTCNKMQEHQKCTTGSKHPVTKMAVAPTIIIMDCNLQCTIHPQVKEWRKGTVQVSSWTTIDGGLEAEVGLYPSDIW